MTALVVEPTEVAAIAAEIERAPLVAFDLEFLAQDRLVPTLCLVQVAWTPASAAAAEGAKAIPAHDRLDAIPGAVDSREAAGAGAAAEAGAGASGGALALALVDPLSVDVGPIIAAIAAHTCAVAHAARQDLQLLATRYGATVKGIEDTQVMAAFAGLGDQIGLAALAKELVGATLGKELQWTDWARRPLTAAQIAYAADDVRHLPAIYRLLAARLRERMPWARAESAGVAADAEAAARVTADTAWKQIGTRGLDAPALAAAVALAAWRFRTATELDRPLGQVLNERALIDLARNRPDDVDGVRGVKNLSPIAKQRAAAIAEVIAGAPAVEAAVRPAWRAPSQRAQRWAEVLVAIAQLVAERTGVAARLLATRADAEELARVVDERGFDAAQELPALATWRREVLGAPWLAWLRGELALVSDPRSPSGLGLVPRT